MYNDLPQSQRDANTERRHRAAIAHVREQESCHFCSGFIDWDGLHVTGFASPSAGGAAVRSEMFTASHQPLKMCAVNM